MVILDVTWNLWSFMHIYYSFGHNTIALQWMFMDALKLFYNRALLCLYTKHNGKEKRLICSECHVIKGKKFAVRYDSQTLIASHSNNLWQVRLLDREWIFCDQEDIDRPTLPDRFGCFSLTGKLITRGSLKGLGRQKKYRPGSLRMGLWSMAFLEINIKRKEFCFFFVVILAKGQYLLLAHLCFEVASVSRLWQVVRSGIYFLLGIYVSQFFILCQKWISVSFSLHMDRKCCNRGFHKKYNIDNVDISVILTSFVFQSGTDC